MSNAVLELAEAIKEKGRRSTQELPPLLEQAEQLARDPKLDPLSRALAYRAAGNALHLLDNFQPALANYDFAISILETLDCPGELGRTLHSKVGLLMFMSKFGELVPCADRARKLFEQIGDLHRLARLDVNLSQAYTRLDRFDLALECTERALPVLEETGDREGFLVASLNSGIAFTWMHKFDQAEQRYHRALTLAEELGMSALRLLCRYNISYLDYLVGNTAKALREIEAVRSEYSKIGDDRHVCLCWLDEADILLEVGNLQDAVNAARNARELGARLKLNSEIGKSLLFEAVAMLRLGQSDEAVTLLDDATGRFQAENNGVWGAVAKLQTALFQGECGNVNGICDAAAARSLLKNSGLPHRLAFANVVIGRIQRAQGDTVCAINAFREALVLAEECGSEWMQFHAAYELGVALSRESEKESLDLFQRAEKMLDSLWNRLGSDDLKLAFLNDRENVYTHLVRSNAETSAEKAFELSEKARSRVLRERLTSKSVDLKYLQAGLAADQAILEYFVIGNDLTIFVLSSQGLTCVRRRGAIQTIRSHCQYLERHFASCSMKWELLATVHGQLARTAQHHLKALYRDLIEPVASQLPRRVVISPHGSLHAVPFHALWDGDRFLIDTHDIAYSPSAALYCSPTAYGSLAPPVFVAFAPDGRTTSVNEVEEAAGHFKDAVVLINPSASELREVFTMTRSLVHLAGHAGIDTVGGAISWIETSEGRLTGRNLTDMAISAKTLVITGCQTARRAISAGDEWQGLMRAFYLAGATTIVSAFWDIRDEAARRFASEFYKCFDGSNAESAVKTASAAIRDWRSHPYFWAGFGAFLRRER